ncbi:hypothetical protein tinsulaeT_34200 [Thalassotalea insulae]|uniref:DUF2919 family protein n=1 Tax=Thalassotalea insulae TaxID=2056778 RepID=A0ABQ6H016_9GAMM|nr:DUF2919 family protein [Thalassotalea insulae]GLX80080.1 hypothetical protein tinsulaeT_34200 [Thalassotalea insulae]
MSHRYANYTPADFDNFDCVKISKGIYLLLIFVLRGYFVWLMSVTNMKDRVSIIQWVYPDPTLFYLSLISGAVGLYVVAVLSLRRPDARTWVRRSWQKLRVILLAALAFDFVVNLLGFIYLSQVALWWVVVNAIIGLLFCLFLFYSKRVKLNIEEFPQQLPEK